MPRKTCPKCNSADLTTDYSAGQTTCNKCAAILEESLLVSEVGFSEGAGGKVHVQGTFVSNLSTGISNFRGRNNQPSSENVKRQGRDRINTLAQQMVGINHRLINGAQRLFGLAVDNNFNRGRKTEYIVASCLYLQSRLTREPFMLIDFSERLRINVFELGHTYLSLRNVLHLPDPMPEVDPAIYNIRFANRLDFGIQCNTVAKDASRLVRRFKADWMSQGRRPAGVCGACLVIAARINNFLRTPDEVAQIVKVGSATIRKRLVEFAQTDMAGKTLDEFRKMTDADLDQENGEEPPVMREAKRKAERERLEVLRIHQEKVAEEDDNENEGDEEEEELVESSRKRRTRTGRTRGKSGLQAKGKALQVASRAKRSRKGKGRASESDPESRTGSAFPTQDVESDDDARAIREAADAYGDGGGADGEVSDPDMEALEAGDYINDLSGARENPDEVSADQRTRARALKRDVRAVRGEDTEDIGNFIGDTDLDQITSELDEELEGLISVVDEEGDDNQEGAVDEEPEDGADQVEEGNEGEAEQRERRPRKKPKFEKWDDPEAVIQFFKEHYFSEDERLLGLSPVMLRERIHRWLRGREPQVVLREIQIVDAARTKRERDARARPEAEFPDINDGELDEIYMLDEDEINLRTRIWLSHNGKWLQKDKERQEQKAAYNAAHGVDPSKPKPKRKRKTLGGPPTQFATAREAIADFAAKRNFSTRVNYDALRIMGLGGDDGLQAFDDEKEDDEKYEDEKGDDEKEDDDADDDEKDEEDIGNLDVGELGGSALQRWQR